MKFGCSRPVTPLIVQRITVGVQRKPTVSQFRVRSRQPAAYGKLWLRAMRVEEHRVGTKADHFKQVYWAANCRRSATAIWRNAVLDPHCRAAAAPPSTHGAANTALRH